MTRSIRKAERKTIYLVDGSIALTGAYVSAVSIARALRGVAEVVLVLPDTSSITDEQAADFARVVRLPIRPLRRSARAIMAYLPMLLASSVMLARELRRHQADTLIMNDFNMMQGAVARLFGFRGRLLTWVRINPTGYGRIGQAWLWGARQSSDQVVAVSRYIQQLLPAGLTSTLLYDAIDPQYEGEPPASPSAGLTFVFIGNYIPGKGQDIAVAAMGRVIRSIPDARLEFHGGDMGLQKNRDFRRLLEEQVEALGLTKHVTFGGFADRPSLLLAGKLAALNLSQSESFSRATLEASAAGLAVVATRSGGPEEIIENDQTGLLIPVDDADACAAAMIALCTDPVRARQMGTAGRARVLAEFSGERFCKGLHSVLQLP